MSKAKQTEYAIAEMNLVAPLTSGTKYFINGRGFDIVECDGTNGPAGGFWIIDHRGPKWWVPGTNVLSVKYEPKAAA